MPILTTQQEIRQLQNKVQELEKLLSQYFTILETTTDFIYVKDTGHRFTSTSQAFANITKHENWRDLIGKTDFDIFPLEHALSYYQHEIQVIENGTPLLNHEEPYYDTNGVLRWVTSSKVPIIGEDGKIEGLVGISRDITEVKNKEEKILKLSLRDQLTGLCNRRAFMETGQQLLNTSIRNGQELALIFFDLDNFKQINDNFGHAVGDEVLKTFSKILAAICRTSEVLARIGGDEFVVLLSSANPCNAAESLTNRVVIASQSLIDTYPNLSISFGISTTVKEVRSLESLLDHADKRMYKHKKSKK